MPRPTLAALAPNLAAALNAGNPLLPLALAEAGRIILPTEGSPSPEQLHEAVGDLSAVDQARLKEADKGFKRRLAAYRIGIGGDALDEESQDRYDARAFARATGMLFHNRLAIGLLLATAVMDLSTIWLVMHGQGGFDNFTSSTISAILAFWHGAVLLMLGFYYGTTFKNNAPTPEDNPKRRATDQK